MFMSDMGIDRATVPDTIVKAVQFMYAGVALALVQVVVAALVDIHRSAIVVSSVITGAIVAWVWWLVARACLRGRPVGRVLASVFFVLSTLGMLETFSGQLHVDTPVAIVDTLSWLAGLGAIAMLWTNSSSDFFQSRRGYTD